MLKVLLTLLIYWTFSVADAQPAPLPAEQAFAFSGYLETNNQIILKWHIAPGYYLYQNKLNIAPVEHNQVKIGQVVLPPGQAKQDTIHGVYQVYSDNLTIQVPLQSTRGWLGLVVGYQGCSDQGFCYAPVEKNLSMNLPLTHSLTNLAPYFESAVADKSVESDQDYASRILAGNDLLLTIGIFLFLGLLLAFTPCVLPMVPILSSIIVEQGRHLSTKKAFYLSLVYVIGMALAYAVAGVLVALMGSRVQVAMQQPWVIVLFSGLFVLLALSLLFGWYDIKLPNGWHQKLVSYSHRHKGGTYVGVFLMGVFSTLIVSPCVSAPLVGALAYIGNSGNVWLGGTALFFLGIGMGIPLLLIGTSAGKLLPKAGPWMDKIKQLFGLFMLALAVWMLGRILPQVVTLCLWALLVMLTAALIWQIKHSRKLWHKLNQGLGFVVLSYGFILLGGVLSGHTDLFQLWGGAPAMTSQSTFSIVNNMDELNAKLMLAKQDGKQVLLDFYADWCASCIAMDKYVFNQPEIQRALSDFVLLRADVTRNNHFDQSVLKRFQVVAPPTMVFFDTNGVELPRQDIVGEVSKKDFLSDLSQVHGSQKLIYCENNARSC